MRRKSALIGITTDIKDESFSMDAPYSKALASVGGVCVLVPSMPDKSFLQGIVANLDGILLPGGRDMDPRLYGESPHPKLRTMHPARTESELIIIEEALRARIPILGVCGGMQTINVFFGGSLYQDIPSLIPSPLAHEMGAVHEVGVEEGSLLHRITGERGFSVKSYHHQSVHALGRGLRITARSADGVVEALESADSDFILGLQWHPEREGGGVSDRIFRAFVGRCRGD
ncbi:MAG: gamma-glutamyl-gamma-aminobutyrate hydrolase family protein [Deltaproteobacteria bacterium]